MKILKWLERRLFSGEVLRDYGDVSDDRFGIAHSRTSVQLCRRQHKLQLVFRNVSTALLAASVRYWTIDVTPQSLQRLSEILSDAKAKLEGDLTPKS